jgi:hypothetical protein
MLIAVGCGREAGEWFVKVDSLVLLLCGRCRRSTGQTASYTSFVCRANGLVSGITPGADIARLDHQIGLSRARRERSVNTIDCLMFGS